MPYKKIIIKFLKLFNLLSNKTTRRGLFHNIPATIELEELLVGLELDTVIDIGSNKGQFILLVEKMFNNVKILSFEPIKEVYLKQKKFFSKNKNIDIFNFGLGAKKKDVILNISKKNDSSSILKIKYPNQLSKKFEIIENRKISIKTLDEILSTFNLKKNILIKLDVQGYELEVLRGANEILSRIKYIIIEIAENQFYKDQETNNSIINYLNQKNFEILKSCNHFKIEEINYSQKDFLFVNRNLIEK